MDEKTFWPDGQQPKTVLTHYGYSPEQNAYARGYWPRETLIERLSQLGEYVECDGLDKKKFRIVIDYDPEFPRALVATFCPPEQSNGR